MQLAVYIKKKNDTLTRLDDLSEGSIDTTSNCF